MQVILINDFYRNDISVFIPGSLTLYFLGHCRTHIPTLPGTPSNVGIWVRHFTAYSLQTLDPE